MGPQNDHFGPQNRRFGEVSGDYGYSTGWRIGRKWEMFFLELDFLFSKNNFDQIEPAIPMFEGSSTSYGFTLNTGLDFQLSERVELLLGLGAGNMWQEMNMSFVWNKVNDEDSLLVYQVFTGLNFYLGQNLMLGTRYKWQRLSETDFFSKRDVHMVEVSFGWLL